MSIKQQIEANLKQALLGGDKITATSLRGLKSAILDEEIAKNARESGLAEEQVISLLQKEAKKRQESADLFFQGGNTDKAEAERVEKLLIEEYLPQQLTDEELSAIIKEMVEQLGASGPQEMGKVIGAVKAKVGGQADGGRISAIVKELMTQ